MQKTLPSAIFAYIILPMSSCSSELPQYKKSPPNTQSPAYLQKGLDTRVVPNIILTAHSSQLTAHSSQLTAHSVRAYSPLHSNPLHTASGLAAAHTSSCAQYNFHISIAAAQCSFFLNITVYVPQPLTKETAHTAVLSLPHLAVKKPP